MRSLLVVKPSSLGDIVHTLPAVALIKRAHPHLSIRWVVRSEFLPLLESNPDLDGTIEFPRSQMRGPGGVFKLLRWSKANLRQPQVPDLAIDFQGLARSGVMAWRSGAREVIGLSDSREGARLFHRWRVRGRPRGPRGRPLPVRAEGARDRLRGCRRTVPPTGGRAARRASSCQTSRS